MVILLKKGDNLFIKLLKGSNYGHLYYCLNLGFSEKSKVFLFVLLKGFNSYYSISQLCEQSCGCHRLHFL